MSVTQERTDAYSGLTTDCVRGLLERDAFARALGELITRVPGGRVLDLGCGDAMVADILGDRAGSYTGVDLLPVERPDLNGTLIEHDLATGLGPVGDEPYDLYIASFGVGSHVEPCALDLLINEIRAHGTPGSVVAIECLALHSLEWPALWDSPPGRSIPYELSATTVVYPWAADELAAVFTSAGFGCLRVLDQSVQFGPKLGDHGYWPGLPELRAGMNALLDGQASGCEAMLAPLPPLPAHPAAGVHHRLAGRRARVVRTAMDLDLEPGEIAHRVQDIESDSGGGYGHRVMISGRIP